MVGIPPSVATWREGKYNKKIKGLGEIEDWWSYLLDQGQADKLWQRNSLVLLRALHPIK